MLDAQITGTIVFSNIQPKNHMRIIYWVKIQTVVRLYWTHFWRYTNLSRRYLLIGCLNVGSTWISKNGLKWKSRRPKTVGSQILDLFSLCPCFLSTSPFTARQSPKTKMLQSNIFFKWSIKLGNLENFNKISLLEELRNCVLVFKDRRLVGRYWVITDAKVKVWKKNQSLFS